MGWAKAIQGAVGLGGSLLGAFGKSGKQGEYAQNSTETSKQHSTYSGEELQDTYQMQGEIEDPLVAQLRYAMLPMLQKELRSAQQPIFTDAQKAQLIQNITGLAEASGSALKAQLARSGALDSGRLAAGLSDIESEKFGQIAGQFSQLPFMEAEARSARLSPLLSLATNWLGKAPTTQFGFGNAKATKSGTADSETTTNRQSTTTMSGPSFGKQLAGDLSALGGDWFAKQGGIGGLLPKGWNS
jgi:hypothetical protein